MSIRRSFTALAIALVASTLTTRAVGDAMGRSPTAQGGAPQKRGEWTLSTDAYISVNPTWWSASLSATFGFGESIGDDRRFGLTIDVDTNDAYVSPSISIEWRVASFLSLLLEYRGFGFYGKNGALLNFGSGRAPYGDDAIDALIGTSAETSGYGQRVALAEKFHAALGPFVFAVQSAVAFYNLASEPGAYLDWETDKLVREVDGVFLVRAAALLPYTSKLFEVAVGPYAETTAAGRTRLVRERIGGLFVMRITDGAAGSSLRFGIAAGVDALDPNRQGQAYFVANLGVDLP